MKRCAIRGCRTSRRHSVSAPCASEGGMQTACAPAAAVAAALFPAATVEESSSRRRRGLLLLLLLVLLLLLLVLLLLLRRCLLVAPASCAGGPCALVQSDSKWSRQAAPAAGLSNTSSSGTWSL